jgi:hypothetical protein
MRNLTSRVEKLERHSVASKDEGILMIVDGMPPARITHDDIIDYQSLHRGLSKERCIEILKECGHLRTRPHCNADIRQGQATAMEQPLSPNEALESALQRFAPKSHTTIGGRRQNLTYCK